MKFPSWANGMQLIVPDVLAAAQGLSAGAAGFGVLLGILLWAFGWRWHRFWIVFGVTLTAGLVGLNSGQAVGGQVLAVGLLMALAAGMLALELARALAFVAGGVAAWALVQTMLPGARELWAVFLGGGLLGLLLYRFWSMLLTSFTGALLAVYASLAFGREILPFDAPAFASKNVVPLNGIVLVATMVGLFVQHRISQLEVDVVGAGAPPGEPVTRKPKNGSDSPAKPAGPGDDAGTADGKLVPFRKKAVA